MDKVSVTKSEVHHFYLLVTIVELYPIVGLAIVFARLLTSNHA